MADKPITYGQLHRLLIGLQFEAIPLERSGKAYRHPESDTLILLADRTAKQAARSPELFAVRRQLIEKGLVAPGEFDRLLAEAS